MAYFRSRSALPAVVVAAVLSLALVALMSVSSAHAEGFDRPESPPAASVDQMQPEPSVGYHIWLTDELSVEITDLDGTTVGTGMQMGEVLCRNKCSKSILVDVYYAEMGSQRSIRYQFTTRQAADPNARRVVVGGKGAIQNAGKNDKFTFTATFEDKGGGAIMARYEASMPEASFIVPESAGRMIFWSQ